VNAIEAEDGEDVRRFGWALEIHGVEEVQGRPKGGVLQVIGR
jgi:hypothetical protein